MSPDIHEIIARVTGSPPLRFQPMGGGCVADVREVTLENGDTIVAKAGDAGANLGLEGFMLKYLRDPGGLDAAHQ